MRPTTPLNDVFANRARTAVLRELVGAHARDLTGRELARRARVAHSQAGHALRALEMIGIVSRRQAGKAETWALEERSALVPEIRALFLAERHARDDLFLTIRRALRHLPVKRAYLFGSVARGTESLESDIDLFVEARREADADRLPELLWSLSKEIRERYGLWLSPLVYSPEKVEHPPNPALLSAILREGIPLLGR